MKPGNILFSLVLLLLSCQIAFPQNNESKIIIKTNNGKTVVSGIVADERTRNEVAAKVKARLGTMDSGQIKIQKGVNPFGAGWEREFDKLLSKASGARSEILIFSFNPDDGYPSLPENIAKAEFSLIDGQKFSLSDKSGKLIVLFFFASWNAPGIRQAEELNAFYPEIAGRQVEFVGISVEDSNFDEKKFLLNFSKSYGFQFKFGLTNEQDFNRFALISQLNGIPQTFIIFNGKLRGIFTGYSRTLMDKLKAEIVKNLDENNL